MMNNQLSEAQLVGLVTAWNELHQLKEDRTKDSLDRAIAPVLLFAVNMHLLGCSGLNPNIGEC